MSEGTRQTFPFEFDLPGGLCVEGHFIAFDGAIEELEYSDGTLVTTAAGSRGWHVDRAPSPFLVVLSNEVLRRIQRNPHCMEEIESTRAVETWNAHAPIVL